MRKNIIKTIVTILGISISTTLLPSVPVQAAPEAYLSSGYYTVRESWTNRASQLGSFRYYENAVTLASKNPGFEVYDPNGAQVYPETSAAPVVKAPAAPVAAAPVQQVNADEIKYTTDHLNLRSGASTGYSVILTMPKGAKVTILDTSGSWSKVSYGTTSGWCSTAYLKGTTAAPVADPTPIVEEVMKYTSDYLNLRSGGATSYGVMLTMPKGAKVTVLGVSADGSWTKVKYGSTVGWASSAYLTGGTTTVTPAPTPAAPAPVAPSAPAPAAPAPAPAAPVVTAPAPVVTPAPAAEFIAAPEAKTVVKYTTDYLNLRTGGSTSYSILTTIPVASKVTVIDTNGGWDKLTYGSYTGWASSAYLKEGEAVKATPVVAETQSSNDISSKLVAAAKSAVGVPYVYGGSSMSGFDCSGLTQWVYKQAGISIPRTATMQYYGLKKVSTPEPGDIIIYASYGSIQHAAIYIGNGQIIHAPDVGRNVEIRALNFYTLSIYGILRGY
ncbi:MAG: SH3 domain-containing protein [Clostridiaceae bacterium]